MKRYIYKFFIGLSLLTFLNACNDDDHTGFSDVTPNNVTVTVNAPSNVDAFVEKDSTFTYTVSIDQPQTVDIYLPITVMDGTASIDDDFTYQTSVTIPARSTSASFTITVVPDDVVEETETFTLQIGDANVANANITPATVTFTIEDLDEDDLIIGLEWDGETPIFDAEGSELDYYDFADLILTVYGPDDTEYVVSDGGSAEEAVIEGDAPDGTYFVEVSIYNILDLGDLGENNIDINLSLNLLQGGVQTSSYSFPAIINSSYAECPGYNITLVKIVKTGTTYSIENAENVDLGLCQFVGDYSANEPGYGDYDVNFSLATASPFTITVDNFWDSGLEVDYVLDGSGGVTIPAQEFDVNVGRGTETIIVEGSGTYDASDGSMAVDYTVTAKIDGVVFDNNTHTFTKQ